MALLMALAAPAPAHAREWAVVVRAEPADGDIIGTAPGRAQLWFNQALDRATVRVTLTDASGRSITIADAETLRYQPGSVGLGSSFDSAFLFICSIDPTRLPSRVGIELPTLGAGTYRLSWQAAALTDARSYSGSVVFQVKPGAPSAAVDQVAAIGVSQNAEDLLVTLSVRPNRPGINFIQVVIADTRRPAPAPIGRVLLRLTPAGGGQGALVEAAPSGAGGYQLPATALPTAGDWRVDVVTERAGLPDAATSFAWNVEAPAALAEPVPSIWLPLGAACLSIALLVAATLLIRRARRRTSDAQERSHA